MARATRRHEICNVAHAPHIAIALGKTGPHATAMILPRCKRPFRKVGSPLGCNVESVSGRGVGHLIPCATARVLAFFGAAYALPDGFQDWVPTSPLQAMAVLTTADFDTEDDVDASAGGSVGGRTSTRVQSMSHCRKSPWRWVKRCAVNALGSRVPASCKRCELGFEWGDLRVGSGPRSSIVLLARVPRYPTSLPFSWGSKRNKRPTPV